MMIMARVLDPEALARRVWDPCVSLPGLEARVWSPEREACIYSGPGKTKRTVVLEMKDELIARLLLSRLDVAQAHAHELITVTGARPKEIAGIADALPFSAWRHHDIDYI